MRKEDFIPGKIYVAVTGYKWSYIGPNPVKIDQGFFLNLDGIKSNMNNSKEEIHSYSYTAWPWKEYKKPRKGTRWINIYSSASGNIFTSTWETKEQANRHLYSSATRIACIEVPWVEGQGL